MKIGIFLDHLREASKQTRRPLETIAGEVAAMGIEILHVNGEFWMENESRIDDLLAKTGLKVDAADLMCQLTQGIDLDKAEKLIRFMARKGAKQLLLIPGFVHPAQSRQSAMDEAARHMKELLYLARSMHVECSLEDFDNADAPYGTWQELQWFVQTLPELGICFDTGNFAFFAQDALEAYEHLEPYICMVHAKDRCFKGRKGERPLQAADGTLLYPGAAGSGEMPISQVLARLKAKGFQGNVIIEHFDSADMMADIRRSAQWMKMQLND